MQKQKTIAKWLAVVLLVTVAIACYIVLSAILPDKADDSTAIADANSQKPSQDEITIPTPVYSTLPRSCEHVDSLEVAHVGGESNDTLLDVIYCFSKTLVIFSSQSTQYDVTESGIYIAVFDEMTLEKTVKIAPSEQRYLGSVQTRNGLVIATGESKTYLTLYNEQLDVCCQTTLDYLESMRFSQTGSTLNAFAYDGQRLHCYSLDNALNAKGSSYLFSATGLKLASLIEYGDSTLLFCNTSQSAVVLGYTRNTGFTQYFCKDKHSIEQVVPISASREQAFVLLLKNTDGYNAVSLSSTLKEGTTYSLSGVQSARLFQGQNGLEILADNRYIKLCSHLDFISEEPISIEGDDDSFKDSYVLKGFDGCCDIVLACSKNECAVYSRDKHILKKLFDIKKCGDLQLLQLQNKTVFIFDCANQNTFSYMCFGKSDVFLISY